MANNDGEVLFDITAIETIFYNDMWNLLVHLAAPMNGLPLETKTIQLTGITKKTMGKIQRILQQKEYVHLQECLDVLRQNI